MQKIRLIRANGNLFVEGDSPTNSPPPKVFLLGTRAFVQQDSPADDGYLVYAEAETMILDLQTPSGAQES